MQGERGCLWWTETYLQETEQGPSVQHDVSKLGYITFLEPKVSSISSTGRHLLCCTSSESWHCLYILWVWPSFCSQLHQEIFGIVPKITVDWCQRKQAMAQGPWWRKDILSTEPHLWITLPLCPLLSALLWASLRKGSGQPPRGLRATLPPHCLSTQKLSQWGASRTNCSNSNER